MKARRTTPKSKLDPGLPRIRASRLMHALLSSLILLTVAVSAQAGAATDTPKTVNIDSRLELFVDDHLIERMSGVSLRLHRPRLSEPVLKFDADWEGPGNHYITIFKDEDIYRMYYRCVGGGDTPPAVRDG